MAPEEIAAKLNIANGADGSCIAQTIGEVDALIGDLVVPPVGNGFLRPNVHERMLARYKRRPRVRSALPFASFANT